MILAIECKNEGVVELVDTFGSLTDCTGSSPASLTI